MKKIAILTLYLCLVMSCVNTPRYFKSAGYDSRSDAMPYVTNYLYYANKLSPEEWRKFYQRFPGYWKDLQTAKQLGSTMEYHPWYTAYAFRWTTVNKKKSWSTDIINRLSRTEIMKGDDIFMIDVASGPADRIVWDNDFEILIYKSDVALILDSGKLSYIANCKGCYRVKVNDNLVDVDDIVVSDGYTDDEVLRELGLERPRY